MITITFYILHIYIRTSEFLSFERIGTEFVFNLHQCVIILYTDIVKLNEYFE